MQIHFLNLVTNDKGVTTLKVLEPLHCGGSFVSPLLFGSDCDHPVYVGYAVRKPTELREQDVVVMPVGHWTFNGMIRVMLKMLEHGTVAKILEGTAGEARNLEFKSGFSWGFSNGATTFAQACTIRAVLGFTNTRYGGSIIIGIDDDGHGNLTYAGVTQEMVDSFQNYEQVQQQLDSFADGPMIYEMGVGEHDGKKYIVVTVSEFAETPVLATKNLKTDQNKSIITKGDVYARSGRSKPSTVKATALELREIIRMAHEKDRDSIMELVRSLQQLSPSAQFTPGATAPYEVLDEDL